MVHHKKLWATGQPELDWVLQAGQGRLCGIHRHVVCIKFTISNVRLILCLQQCSVLCVCRIDPYHTLSEQIFQSGTQL